MEAKVYQYVNCRILWRGKLIHEDLWVRDGKILDPRELFFAEKKKADFKVDCKNLIISPGFIDLQLNGGFAVDFSSCLSNIEEGVNKVAKGLLQYGVTSFCPTLVTSPPKVYQLLLSKIKRCPGSSKGAGILGIHLEGPFISPKKKGAHPEEHIRNLDGGFESLKAVYNDLSNVSMITLAPELKNSSEVIRELKKRSIIVSVGHSVADLPEAELAINEGAGMITHLFNAMLSFHHRDPGMVGLLTSNKIGGQQIYYGLIADGIHTHPAALRIAFRSNPKGLVLVTDAMSAVGLDSGEHKLGQLLVRKEGMKATLAGTNTLAGSVATMPHCIRHFYKNACCTVEEALECATLHPALCFGIEKQKGTLEYGTDADFVFLDDALNVRATFIAGEKVFSHDSF